MKLYENWIYRIFTEKFCKPLIIQSFFHIDIVEVVDSSSTTPTILHQAKPLETSKFPVVFLFPRTPCHNPQKPAKTGSMKQNLRKIYVKLPPQRWADTDVDPALFSDFSHVNENV